MIASLAALRDGSFLTSRTLKIYPLMLVAAFVFAIAFLALTAHGPNDYSGRPLGTDFSNVYAAGVASLKGQAADVFDLKHQWQQERQLFGPDTPIYGWHYPPFFLVVAAALARLPYVAALIVWQLSTLLLYLWAMRALIARAQPQWLDRPLWLCLGLGFTAVLVNLLHGHNGFLTTALFAGGLALIDERPLLAGLLFGLLAYKPQFLGLIPLALATGGYWRSIAAASATVVLFALTVTLLFGVEVWPAFVAGSHFTRTVILEEGVTGFAKIQTFFSQVRLVGGPIWLAYAVQGGVFLVCAFLVARAWHKRDPLQRGVVLSLASLLATPYALDYDLMLLAPALLLSAAEGVRGGFKPYQLSLITLLWLMPFAARNLAAFSHVLIVPFAMLALLAMTVRRDDRNLAS